MRAYSIIFFVIICSFKGSHKFTSTCEGEYCQIKITETNLRELGIDTMVSNTNPFIEIDSTNITEVDFKLNSAITAYLVKEGINNSKTKFEINQTVRQYSGLNSNNGIPLLLIRFYNKTKLIKHYGDRYRDRLCTEGYSYFHFYPDFYFLIYDLEKEKVIFMRW